MPPHRPAPSPLPASSFYLGRGVRLLILASSLALAGCAANRQPTQTADALQIHLRAERDNYLAQTQYDPLGAYLAQSRSQAFSARETGIELADRSEEQQAELPSLMSNA